MDSYDSFHVDMAKAHRDMLIMFIVVTLLLVGALVYFAYEETKINYKMPDGTICKSKMSTGGLGGALKFYGCSNGKIYLNPETYREVNNG